MAALSGLPASTCPGCCKPGRVSEDQWNDFANKPLAGIRWWCPCGACWTTNREAAELQGRFLDRSGLR